MNELKMNTLIKRYISRCSFALALVLAVGCSEKDDPEVPGGNEGIETIITFRVTKEPVASRATLPGSQNEQHVRDVQLYIFNGTGDNAVCVASENIGWAEHFGNPLPTDSEEMTYRVKYKGFTAGSPYTFLAVGVDDNAGSTYGLPAGVVVNSTTLSGAVATLAGGDSNWKAMRMSELFAGNTVLTPDQKGFSGRVELKRRVAGVMGWFTNVPSQIGATATSAIRITLYTLQNKSVTLVPLSQSLVFKDYVNSPLGGSTGGNVLVEIPIPAGTTSSSKLYGGTYVLPVPAPPVVNSNDYSVKIEIVDAGGNVLYTQRMKLSANDVLDPTTSSGTGIIDTEGVYRYPIIANHFYSIGSSAQPLSIVIN